MSATLGPAHMSPPGTYHAQRPADTDCPMQQPQATARVQYARPVPAPDPSGNRTSGRRLPPWWLIGGLAVLALAFWAVAGNPERGTPERATPKAALEAIGAYFDAFARQDVEALTAIIAPDYGAQLLQMEAWRIAQNTERTLHECVAADPDPTGAVSVTCVFDDLTELRRAVGAPPIEYWHRYSVADGLVYPGRISLTVASAEPGFNRWFATEYPEVEASVTCCSWPSVEAAFEDGRIIAGYAEEYAGHLAAIGCRYDEACDLIPTFAAEQVARDFVTALAARDLDAATALAAGPLQVDGGLAALAEQLAPLNRHPTCAAGTLVVATEVAVTCTSPGPSADWTLTVTPNGVAAVDTGA